MEANIQFKTNILCFVLEVNGGIIGESWVYGQNEGLIQQAGKKQLAKEIAAVLVQNNAAGTGRTSDTEITGNWAMSASPPHYQAEE